MIILFFSTKALNINDMADIFCFYPLFVLQGNYEYHEMVQQYFIKFLKLMSNRLANGYHVDKLFDFLK